LICCAADNFALLLVRFVPLQVKVVRKQQRQQQKQAQPPQQQPQQPQQVQAQQQQQVQQYWQQQQVQQQQQHQQQRWVPAAVQQPTLNPKEINYLGIPDNMLTGVVGCCTAVEGAANRRAAWCLCMKQQQSPSCLESQKQH
jgi:hypothetical protein